MLYITHYRAVSFFSKLFSHLLIKLRQSAVKPGFQTKTRDSTRLKLEIQSMKPVFQLENYLVHVF